MAKKGFRRVVRPATDEEKRRHATIRKQVEQEYPPAPATKQPAAGPEAALPKRHGSPPDRRIAISALKPISVLYDGDLYELACFLLRAREAKDREINSQYPWTVTRSRLTVHGIASSYARAVTDQDFNAIVKALAQAGIDLGALVEFDEDMA